MRSNGTMAFIAAVFWTALSFPYLLFTEPAAATNHAMDEKRAHVIIMKVGIMEVGVNTEKQCRHAVLDRISGQLATLLVGNEEQEMVVDLDALPKGSKEGDWFRVDDKGGFIPAPGLTRDRKESIRRKLDMLRGSGDI